MKVNYVLMYGTPYLKYKVFETFEDISKFLVNKGIVNYSIFKKLEDKEEIEMIYRDNDIHYLEKENKRLNNIINELEKKLLELRLTDVDGKTIVYRLLNKLQELKGSNEPSFEEMVGFVENVYKDIKSQSTLHEELEEERKTIAKIVGDFKEIK